ncbi:Cilia- and flagella-associated protein [Schistosoma japonicum]|nr:Cilia- and flagella-associated protein [Schistosoma japonicum]
MSDQEDKLDINRNKEDEINPEDENAKEMSIPNNEKLDEESTSKTINAKSIKSIDSQEDILLNESTSTNKHKLESNEISTEGTDVHRQQQHLEHVDSDNDNDQINITRSLNEQTKKVIDPELFYNIDEYIVYPIITENSGIPMNLLAVYHLFGMDVSRRENLQLIKYNILCHIYGNYLQLINMDTNEKRMIRSLNGIGIGAFCIHPQYKYIAIAEKATVGCHPDYMLTIWEWRNEQIMLRCKAFSQEIYHITWSIDLIGKLTTTGIEHIKFWQISTTFTGLKLQGKLGKFDRINSFNVEGITILPDGKVLTTSNDGNLLVWEDNLIKVQITRKNKQSCHNDGCIMQIIIDEGELMTIGQDGWIRTWDFETVDTAECSEEGEVYELEPMNELRVGTTANLMHIDADGALWKLDLSFSHTSLAPECLEEFHANDIVDCVTSPLTYCAATVGLDGKVCIYDIVQKKILVSRRFPSGGSSLIWSPPQVDPKGKILVVGHQDGVLRVLKFGENPEELTKRSKQFALLDLGQALKPHKSAITSMIYSPSGKLFVTGSQDETVFFFSVQATHLSPIGFINVYGKVVRLEWFYGTNQSINEIIVYLENGCVITGDFDKGYIYKCELGGPLLTIDDTIKRIHQLNNESKLHDQMNHDVINSNELHKIRTRIEDLDIINSRGIMLTDRIIATEPNKAVSISHKKDSCITCWTFSNTGYRLLIGFNDGVICVQLLEKPFDMTICKGFWIYRLHDNQRGRVNRIALTYDEKFVLSAGSDGTLFVCELMTEEMQNTEIKEYRARIPSTFDTTNKVDDITDPNTYSIEETKQKLEQDHLMKLAEERKFITRQKLTELKRRFKKLKEQNNHLPERIRLSTEAFNLVPQIRCDLFNSRQAEIDLVYRETAWETEKHRLALEKLENRFTKPLDCDRITVKAFCTGHCVTSIRMNKLNEEHLNVYNEIVNIRERMLTEEKCLITKNSTQLNTVTTKDDEYEVIKTVTSQLDTSIKGARGLRWKQLEAMKPTDNYDDPKDTEAIQLAIEKLGDYKLKSSTNYMYKLRHQFNVSLLMLRNKKMKILEKLKNIDKQLQENNCNLPLNEFGIRLYIEELDEDEYPEKKFTYNNEILLNFKKQLENDSTKEPLEPSKFTTSTTVKIVDWIQVDIVIDSRLLFVKHIENFHENSIVSQSSTVKSPLTPLEMEQQQKMHIKAVYHRNWLLQMASRLVRCFDVEVRLLRHKRYELDVLLKRTELQQYTLYDEYRLLKEFEKSEHVNELTLKIEQKKKDLERLSQREHQIHEEFKTNLNDSHKFIEFLTKVFKKRIKRFEEESEESSASSSDDDSSYDEAYDESGTDDAIIMDLDTCPPGCPIEDYERTCSIREKRLDVEEEMTEEKRTLDILRKDYEVFNKKQRIIETTLKQAQNELEAFQLEKQRQLNELNIIVILRLDQIYSIINQTIPYDMNNYVIFLKSNLFTLKQRIIQLNEEQIQQQHNKQQAKQHHFLLQKYKKLFQKELEDLSVKCDKEMYDKFGRIDDIEKMENIMAKIRNARDECIEQIQQNTVYLTQLLTLFNEYQQLQQKLNQTQNMKIGTVQNSSGVVDRRQLKQLVQLVKLQTEEINSLTKEIQQFTR